MAFRRKMEAVTAHSSEISLNIYQTRRHVTGNSSFYIHRSDDLIYHSVYLFMHFCGLFKDTVTISDYMTLNWAVGWRRHLLRAVDFPRWIGILRNKESHISDTDLQTLYKFREKNRTEGSRTDMSRQTYTNRVRGALYVSVGMSQCNANII
jgi:hypothetical protein